MIVRVAAVLWFVIILLLLFLPSDDLPSTELIPFQDKVAHFGLFSGYSFLWLLGFAKNNWLSYKRSWVIILLIGLILGVSSEIIQLSIPGRSGDIYDLLMDIIGLGIGTLFYFFVEKRNHSFRI